MHVRDELRNPVRDWLFQFLENGMPSDTRLVFPQGHPHHDPQLFQSECELVDDPDPILIRFIAHKGERIAVIIGID